MALSPLIEPAKGLPMTSGHSAWLTPLVYTLGQWIVLPIYFGGLKVTGQEHLPPQGPVILAPTHRSRWDAITVPYTTGLRVTGRHPRFMVSANEVKGIQGWFIRRLGGFPVDTEHPRVASLRHGVEVLQAGEMLVIFPEGGIFHDRHIHPLKPGMARLALQAEQGKPGLGIKIVPISVHYSDLIPKWRTRIQIAIGHPLSVPDYCQGSVKQSAQKLTDDLEAALKALAASHENHHGMR
ncbi:1-acyl-sn-glycerol-3-phosphate acyltransferase [Leptolyngbya sp. 'hensonii']|nr:1-acyl-sn-glycerol-3-phosphate acyltransferase [Leptolyngbya sp. 'hensonii']